LPIGEALIGHEEEWHVYHRLPSGRQRSNRLHVGRLRLGRLGSKGNQDE
jgi:hypothetical protein